MKSGASCTMFDEEGEMFIAGNELMDLYNLHCLNLGCLWVASDSKHEEMERS